MSPAEVMLPEAVHALALDAVGDVELARELAPLAAAFQRSPGELFAAWDRAATSFRTLAVYCEQRRDGAVPE